MDDESGSAVVTLQESHDTQNTGKRKSRQLAVVPLKSIPDALDRFHIVGKKDLFPSQLSGGQQQLVAVARAVSPVRSSFLPMNQQNLHSSQGKEIMGLFKKLNEEGTTIVQVTHNENWAANGNQIIQRVDGWIT